MKNTQLREFAEKCSYPNFFDVEKYTALVIREVADKCFLFNDTAYNYILKTFEIERE